MITKKTSLIASGALLCFSFPLHGTPILTPQTPQKFLNSVETLFKELDTILGKDEQKSGSYLSKFTFKRKKTTDPQKAKSYVPKLEVIREKLFVLLRRTSDSAERYHNEVKQSLDANFQSVPITSDQVYDYLFQNLNITMETAEEINKKINAKLTAQATPEKDKKILRQIGYLFRNYFTKEEFDAFRSSKKELMFLWIGDKKVKNQIVEFIQKLFEYQSKIAAL